MTILSGRYGVVNGIHNVTEWGISLTDSGEDYVDSSTRAGHVRNPGIKDATGYFNVHGGAKLLFPGTYFNFTGYPGPSSGIFNTPGFLWKLPDAIVDSLTINWSWEKTQKLNSVYNFSQGLAPYDFGSGTYTDVDYTLPTPICGLSIKYSNDDNNYINYPSMVNATLTISSANQETNTSYSGCYTYRLPGIIDWTLAITEQNEEYVMTIGSVVSFRLYTSSTTYWELRWGILQGWSNLVVDINTGRIIQKTANFAMCGNKSNAIGYIKYNAETLWP